MINIPISVGKKMLDLSQEVGHFLFYHLDNYLIICRPLTVGEINSIDSMSNIIPEVSIEDWVCEKVVIYSEVDLESKGFYNKALCKAVLDSVRFKETEELLSKRKEIKKEINILSTRAEDVICQAFKGLTPRDVQQMTQNNWLNMLTRSESILNIDLFPEKKRGKKGFTSIGGDPIADAEAILSKELADIPDFTADNRELNG